MNIFYAVQATGNGHISRAMTLLPQLQQYGNVDIFLSGDNSNLVLNAPVKYRSKGISLYYNCKGGLDYWQMLKKIEPMRVRKECRDLPVEKYDLILNDFDFITSVACTKKNIPSIHFGHQASFQSVNAPRPEKKSLAGETLLKKYVKASQHVGLHFETYDQNIFGAIIKKEILEAEPVNKGHITVYLPSYCEVQLAAIFHVFPDFYFEIFSKETAEKRIDKNICFIPVDKELFNKSLISCFGIICGAGFETPAEALHLGKKILAIPISGQYEQQCNAAALSQMGVYCLKEIGSDFSIHFSKWIQNNEIIKKDYSGSIQESLDHIFTTIPYLKEQPVEALAEEFLH